MKPVVIDDYPHIPVLESDERWDKAESTGEVSRQTASRWAGEALGICAPGEL